MEASTDNGQTWTVLRSFTGTETAWNRERINLAAYTGQANLGLRFHLTSDGANQQDGWYMDDLTVREEAVKATYPFFDDVETGESPWFFTTPWGRTTTDKFSGSHAWTDSPGGSYAAGTDNSLQVTIDLGSAVMPVLSFWQKYTFEANADYGYVEVREVGTSAWNRLFFVTGPKAAWEEARIDLSNYAGKQIDLRFRVVTNGDIQSDGWLIDDIRIGETERASMAYPFRDDMEDPVKTSSYWHPSTWSLVADPFNGSMSFTDSPQGNYAELIWSELIMAHTMDMTGAAHPQLSFWHKHDIYSIDSIYCSGTTSEYDYGRVYVSAGNGQDGSWTQVGAFKGNQGTWKREQLDLSGYAGLPKVRIKFVMDDNKAGNGNCNHFGGGWTIDDIVVENAPLDVHLSLVSSSMNTVNLSWTQNIDADFNRYEIYRSSSPGVTRNGARVVTLSAGKHDLCGSRRPDPAGTYYYRLVVYDTDGNVSMAATRCRPSTPFPPSAIPSSRMGRTERPNGPGASLGLADVSVHSGTYAWTDSPEPITNPTPIRA